MAEKQLRCFVAMAVGRADINRLYDKSIAPTLRASKITPVFMGRLEHNDDIDKRIVREIEQCDFALADLTYARPSVYFEAGYAQRKVPVIFTVRHDHFTHRTKDEFGNYRVHFDLLMRNIIGWSKPDDPRFPSQLARRIKTVIAPILTRKHLDERAVAEEAGFQRLPLAERLKTVLQLFVSQLKRSGYKPLVKQDWTPWWVGRIPRRTTLSIGVVDARHNFSQKEIVRTTNQALELLQSRFEKWNDSDGFQRWQIQWPGYVPPRPAETKDVKAIVARIFLCSLESIPRNRASKALPLYSTDDDAAFVRNKVTLIPTQAQGRLDTRVVPTLLKVYIVDGIKSAAALKSKVLARKVRAIRPRPRKSRLKG